ncbi:MAG: glutathione S-transferase N-terminal domain-containing protein [Pseudomonadota bacterium]
MSLIFTVNLGLSMLASALRLGAGAAGRDGVPGEAAQQPLELFEFEGCPFCRVAREAISQAGVATIVYPCPKSGARFRPEVKARGGKAQFPYLIDPNTDEALYESGDIARYIRNTYGGARPLVHWLGPFNHLSSQLATLARGLRGTFAAKSRQPEKRLELRAGERDPGARLVKEILCERETAYLWTPLREPDAVAAGPVLKDPNTGDAIAGAARIRRHLLDVYAA